MLATNAELEVLSCFPPSHTGGLHERSNAGLVERREGILREDFVLQIVRKERANVIAGEPKGHLRQVVGPKAEELGVLGDFVCGEGGARNLDHGSDKVVKLDFL